MCGRFTLTISKELIERELGIQINEYHESYNIAPTQNILGVVGSKEGYRAGYFKWGLVPKWAKDLSIGSKMINARSETIEEKRSFQPLLSRRRCVIVADSFYEWKREEGKKVPYRIMVNNNQLFTFAGLWDRWEREGQEVISCTILTVQPNDLMSEIHDRMPVILDQPSRELWLNPSVQEEQKLKSVLKPYNADEMSFYQVSSAVNNPRNNDESLIEQV
ncbi:SOS response-associated peptidase [Gracilibacillus oryzae]|uniref:Abasic site processing protein n=1 Tax=Gracilibacillus oryzae TaxID=1672701 RepID=A0A7C8GU06_9BACI|nr:SOS response-associated peptidase [Gracilibacillus oryzae]KAB8137842.1 SOS response-associated peptidase [Gracilibacillus oryzae]